MLAFQIAAQLLEPEELDEELLELDELEDELLLELDELEDELLEDELLEELDDELELEDELDEPTGLSHWPKSLQALEYAQPAPGS